MSGTPKSLARGVIGTSETLLYECPRQAVIEITLMDFANNHNATVTTNIWKVVNGTKSHISPVDFLFRSKYLAQETSTIVLGGGEQIVGQADVADVVEYHLNGIETSLPNEA